MKIRLKTMLPVVILVIGSGVTYSMMKTAKTEPVIESPASALDEAPYVTTRLVNSDNHQPQLSLYGYLRSAQEIEMYAPNGSKVEEVMVENGQSVTEGQVLVRFTNEDLKLQQASLTRQMVEIKSQISQQKNTHKSNLSALDIEKSILKLNKQSVDRLSRIAGKSLTAASDVESAERNYNNQRLVVNNRELAISKHSQTLSSLNSNLAELTVRKANNDKKIAELTMIAEFAGRVENISVSDFDSTNNEAILMLIDDASPVIDAQISLKQVNQLSGNTSFKNSKAFAVLADQTVQLSLKSSAALAKSGTQALSFSVDTKLINPILNRYVKMILPLPAQKNVYQVPNTSVYSNNHVYLVIDNQLKRQPIEVIGRTFYDLNDQDALQENSPTLLIRSQKDLNNQPLLVTRLSDATESRLVNVAKTIQGDNDE